MKKVLPSIFTIMIIAVLMGFAHEGQAQSTSRANTLKEPNLGYTISYPGDWVYAYQAPHIVIFTPRKGKDGGPVISLRNLNSTKIPGGRYKDSDAVIETLMTQLKTAKDVSVYEPEPYPYAKGQTKLMGKQLTAEYSIRGEKYKQYVVVLPRPTGEVFHLWSFVAPEKAYEAFLPTAKAMLHSIDLQ
ncbi:MAG TPA: hypothetical protein VGJ94_11785 [Syntrophorhabdaceae bacterium]|jgi:hypothetical protein